MYTVGLQNLNQPIEKNKYVWKDTDMKRERKNEKTKWQDVKSRVYDTEKIDRHINTDKSK